MLFGFLEFWIFFEFCAVKGPKRTKIKKIGWKLGEIYEMFKYFMIEKTTKSYLFFKLLLCKFWRWSWWKGNWRNFWGTNYIYIWTGYDYLVKRHTKKTDLLKNHCNIELSLIIYNSWMSFILCQKVPSLSLKNVQ